ncbi:MAG: dihydroorotase [Clostridiaceae bacterium BRH_c20a]|nr:MAG: dihydroorotase [Clostridiaceae bacterium BRH_c20a]
MLLLKNGLLVDPSQNICEKMDILIANSKVVELGKDIKASPDIKVIDVNEKIVAPGFIDMHVHLREPGFEHKETILSGCRAAARGGFTGIACMPNTNPVADTEGVIELILARAKRYDLVEVYPIASITKGQEGKELTEFAILHECGAIALSEDGHSVRNSGVMRRALDYAKMLDLLIISHCEDEELAGSGVMHEGLISTQLGLAGIPREVEDIIIDRDIRLAELTKGRIHIAHVSTKSGVELIRAAKKRGVKVTAEVTPHHFSLTDAAVKGYCTNTKVNPPLRTEEDVYALIQGLQDGTIDCIATDHAPHAREEKDVEFDYAPYGISGLETAVPLAWQNLYLAGHLSMLDLVKTFTTTPAKILGIDRGTVQAGKNADITVIDPELTQKVKRETFYSLGKNTPFQDWELTGWPILTIKAGKIVMEKGEVNE